MGNLRICILIVFFTSSVFSLGLKDIDKLDRLDRQDYTQKARKKADNENFEEAYTLLKKAKSLGLNYEEYKYTKNYISNKEEKYKARLERQRKEKERLARLKKQREERARQARARQNAQKANYGLAKSQCYLVSGNYALYQYCTRGSCDGFSSNYALHQLCEYNSARGFNSSNRNTEIYLYLTNGGYLSYDNFSNQAAYQSGNFNGSFQDRKNYILYLLSGFQLGR